MTRRAFIIAIEKYGMSKEVLANELIGTNEAALNFRQWCITQKEVKEEDIYFCAGPECAGRTTGVTRAEIKAALGKLLDAGRDDTEELYFFFSGHGFSYPSAPFGVAVDVLVGADFETLGDSGDACLVLQQIRQALWYSLGRGEHYYFIDACRNFAGENEVSPIGLGLARPPSELGRPSTFMLFSTRQGSTAAVKSGFATVLLNGLSGSGRAKTWIDGRLRVTFEQLFKYMKSQLQDQLADPDRKGPGDGVIKEFLPAPQYRHKIHIVNADPADTFNVVVKSIYEVGAGKAISFQGADYPIELTPNDYYIQVFNDAAQVVQVQPPPKGALDLFDDAIEVQFKKEKKPAAAGLETASVTLASAAVGPGLKFSLENIHTEDVTDIKLKPVPSASKAAESHGFGGGFKLPLPGDGSTRTLIEFGRPKGSDGGSASAPRTRGARRVGKLSRVEPGRYMLRVQRQGLTVHTQEVEVGLGEKLKINLPKLGGSTTQELLMNLFVKDPQLKPDELTRTLGEAADWDLGLGLTLLGARHILTPRTAKKSLLPLEPFPDMEKGTSCVYVLAGLEKTKGGFSIGLGKEQEVDWQKPRRVKGLPGVFEWRMQSPPASNLLSLKLPGQAPLTFALYCLPNRATFLSLAENAAGRLSIHQFLLPISSLIQYLPPTVLRHLQDDPLQVVQMMFLAQSRFARGRDVAPPEPDSVARKQWVNVLYQKWLDPVMTMIASYELIRQGQFKEKRPMLRNMLNNLRSYFAGIPDIEAIAKLTGEPWTLPKDPPLLLDGVQAFAERAQEILPLDQNKLDYGSYWTTWRGAVSADDVKSGARSTPLSGGGTKRRGTTAAVKRGRSQKLRGTAKVGKK